MSVRQTILNQVMRFADPADMDVGNWDICTDNILSALEAAGYAVAPKEPTTEMYFAFYSPDAPSVESVQSLWTRRYKAMLTAAKETK